MDLLLVGRKSHEISVREYGIWGGIWIAFALVFAVLLEYEVAKLRLHEWVVHFGFKPVYTLCIILFVFTASFLFSVIFPKKQINYDN